MGFRLQRSIRLGKFIRLNISKSGVGISAGVPGLRLSHGPSGSYFTAGLPGTGLSYRKKIGSKKKQKETSAAPQQVAAPTSETTAELESAPGFFSPREEKELARALEDYEADRIEEALDHFLQAAAAEPGAAILAAAIIAERGDGSTAYEATELLEQVIEWEDEFPTPLMEKYLADMEVEIEITPRVSVVLPIDALAATLLLIELYQKQRRVREAIALLEEIETLTGEPTLTLSLCELYATRNLWDNLIDRAKKTEPEDDVTLETLIFYGRALLEKELYEAALTIFTKALRRKKDRAPELLHEAMYWRATVYQRQGHHKQANTEFQRLFAEAPDFRDVAARLKDYSLK
jgi:tetratricopeptide (TPR) repeat protein